MQGQVLWFRPGTGRGVVRSEGGHEWSIATQDDQLKLRGGDVIEFEPQGDEARSPDRRVRLVERGGARYSREQSDLVREFLESVRQGG